MTPQFKKYNGLLFLMLDEPELKDGQLIIGYLVADGSAEWALYQMMQGNAVSYISKRTRYMYMSDKDSIEVVYCSGARKTFRIDTWIGEFKSMIGWRIHKEEPKPQYQVGDWVEIKDSSGDAEHCQITRVNRFCPKSLQYLIDDMWFDCHGKEILPPEITTCYWQIIRKLTPFEVIVDFGAFKGTVRPVSTNRVHLWVHVVDSEDNTIASIRLQALEPNLRKLVEELLEAQEEK